MIICITIGVEPSKMCYEICVLAHKCEALKQWERTSKGGDNEMSDLIRREDVLDKAILVPIAKVVTEDKVIYRKVVFVEDIESLPSAKSKTGEWIRNDDYICDQCGYHMIVGGGAYNFCPSCGAAMKQNL